MGTKNQFDLLVDVDNEDPSYLIAAAEKKAAASPKPALAAPAKLPIKPPPPAQAVRESSNYGAPARDGAGRGGLGRSRGGFRGGRMGPRREFGEGDTNGYEGGYGGGRFEDGGVLRREDGEGKASERGRGPRQPYRGGGRRGGFTDGEAGDESSRPPRRAYERHSGTGRGYEMKREGSGRGNWGIVTDEALAQETVEVVNTVGTPAVTGDENKLEEVPQSEVEKEKEGEPNEEESEDKEMTLEEYEKLLEEKRKAVLALKTEERKVEVDRELQSMQQLSVRKGTDEVFIKLGSDKDKKKENAERDERAKKSVSINDFLKPAEGERYYSPGGRGRGRGRGDRGGFRGGYSSREPAHAPAPAIQDQAQFPTLAGK
ncbi:RGG repeats nuclear RNA binding protein A-like [Phragmites australis]|uniref:RGG repeats nuclear RNA binding protein A-like n=1 Tax=Phragmites australis TaxID=29695 RepID=UPI002D7756FA|nr:RGG repeats nuclear RNA binding protein A-like [Phragmites australis]